MPSNKKNAPIRYAKTRPSSSWRKTEWSKRQTLVKKAKWAFSYHFMLFFSLLLKKERKTLGGIGNNTYLCEKDLDNMPEVFRKHGFLFFFYSKEHEPIHIHVEGEEGLVIYDLKDDSFVQRELKGKLKSSSLKKIEKALSENKSLIVKTWNKHFGEEEE